MDSEQKLKKSDETVAELHKTISDQSKELTILRGNELTPQKQDLIRMSAQAEFDKIYQSRQRILYDENMVLKAKNASLMQENASIKADIELRENEFRRVKSELITKYERNIESLKQEKNAAAPVAHAVDLQRFREVQRNKDQLEMRALAQQAELERTATARSKWEEEQEHLNRSQSQKLLEKEMQLQNVKVQMIGVRRRWVALDGNLTSFDAICGL